MKRWKTEFLEKGKPMNLVSEISDNQVKVIFACSFGNDISDKEVDYLENGKIIKRRVSEAIMEILKKLVYRMFSVR